MRALVVLAALVAAPAVAPADEGEIKLKDGPGKDELVANCATCHSLDYIPMNSPFLDRKGWEAEVNKMIKAFGAPVSAEDAPKIVNYLVENYAKK
jgi:cytochrome c553